MLYFFSSVKVYKRVQIIIVYNSMHSFIAAWKLWRWQKLGETMDSGGDEEECVQLVSCQRCRGKYMQHFLLCWAVVVSGQTGNKMSCKCCFWRMGSIPFVELYSNLRKFLLKRFQVIGHWTLWKVLMVKPNKFLSDWFNNPISKICLKCVNCRRSNSEFSIVLCFMSTHTRFM